MYSRGGSSGEAAVRRFTNDSLVSSLLILHDLHPDDVETRIGETLRKMHAQAELVGVFDGVVRVRLSGERCGLKESVEAAIRAIAPDVTEVVIEERPSQGSRSARRIGDGDSGSRLKWLRLR